MFDSYLLETYMISDDSDWLAIEATIEGNLGDTKIARKEKRLTKAVEEGDDEEAKRIHDEIKRQAEEAKAVAKREKNLRIAKSLFSYASLAMMLADLILSKKNSHDINKAMADIRGRNGGGIPSDVQTLIEAQNKGAAAGATLGKINSIIGVVGSIVGGL